VVCLILFAQISLRALCSSSKPISVTLSSLSVLSYFLLLQLVCLFSFWALRCSPSQSGACAFALAFRNLLFFCFLLLLRGVVNSFFFLCSVSICPPLPRYSGLRFVLNSFRVMLRAFGVFVRNGGTRVCELSSCLSSWLCVGRFEPSILPPPSSLFSSDGVR